jgi:hypothetical protein
MQCYLFGGGFMNNQVLANLEELKFLETWLFNNGHGHLVIEALREYKEDSE